MALTNHLNEIAEAIREKTGDSAKLTMSNMAAAIKTIPSSTPAGSVIAPAASDYTITNKFSAIGNAIRSKTGGTSALSLAQMPAAIRGINFNASVGLGMVLAPAYTGMIITGIGDCTDSDIVIPATVEVEGLIPPTVHIKEIQEDAFLNNTDLTSLIISSSIKELEIMDQAFKGCTNLTFISLGGTTYIRRDGVKDGAFTGCTKLSKIDFGNKLQHIGHYSFEGCTALEEITLPMSLAEPNESLPINRRIMTTAFIDCPNLKDIYVPWAEGAVSNAPWGADNATVHYNHTA